MAGMISSYSTTWQKISAICVVVISIFAITIFSFRYFNNIRGGDYFQFWVSGQAMKSMAIDNLYAEYSRDAIKAEFTKRNLNTPSQLESKGLNFWNRLELIGTPLLYSVFYLGSEGDYDSDHLYFRIISIVFYLAGIALLMGILDFPLWSLPIGMILATFFFWPVRVDIRDGNVNELQIGLLSLILWMRTLYQQAFRDISTGFLFACLVLFKPTFIYADIILFWIIILRRDYKSVIFYMTGSLIGILIGFFLPKILFHNSCQWTEWYPAFKNIVFTWRYVKKNFLFLLLHDISIQTIRIVDAMTFFSFLCFIYSLSKNRLTKSTAKFEFLAISLVLVLNILTGPLVHGHYFVLAIPLILFLTKTRYPITHSVLYIVVAIAGFLLINSYPFLRGIESIDIGDLTVFSYWGALILFVAGMVRMIFY